MSSRQTGQKGSRASQKKHRAAKRKPGQALTVDDFDLDRPLNGNKVDTAEGREARLPYVIRGMRQNKSIREIAFAVDCSPATIALDKKWVLEEAWHLRQDLIWLWLEEQLQDYEHLLGLLSKELQVELMEKQGEGKDARWVPKKDKEGNPILVVNHQTLDKMLVVMDKVNELKGLKQPDISIPITPGENATFNINADAAAARGLLDVLKPRGNGRSKTSLVS